MTARPSVAIDPPLERGEVGFLAAFAAEAAVRRVWPGQPSRRCPWRPSTDGRRLELVVDEALLDPDSVGGWLRFLSREFLAPSTAASLDLALTEGLRGGHRLTGTVVIPGDRTITVQLGRVVEEPVPEPEVDAIVVDMDSRRPQTDA